MKAPAFLLLICMMGSAAAGSETTSVHPAGRRALAGRDLLARKDPPSTGPGYSEGFVFSFIVPGFTPLTFSANRQKALCADISAVSGLPPKVTMNCTISTTASFNTTSTIASGSSFANWAVNPTAADESALVAARDAWLKTLTASPSSVFKTFPGTVPNCACAGLTTVTKPSTSDFTYTTTVLPLGPLQCDARLTYPGDAPTLQVGIDDGTIEPANLGKFCSTPAVTGGVLGTPGTSTCIEYGVVATPLSKSPPTQAEANPASVIVYDGTVVIGYPALSKAGSGYTVPPAVTISAPNPRPVTFTWNLFNNGNPMYGGYGNLDINMNNWLAQNGPYERGTDITLTELEDVCVDVGLAPIDTNALTQTYACTGPIKTITFMDELNYTGRACTAADFNNGVGGCSGAYLAEPNPGSCASMSFESFGDVTGNTFLTSVTFPGWAPHCSKAPLVTVSAANLQAAVNAEATAEINEFGEVTALTVTNPGSGYRWIPKVTIAPPSNADVSHIGKLCSATPVAGLDPTIALPFPISAGVTPDGVCRPLGRDTYLNKPCSVPAVAGGIWAPLDAFTCNVESSFRTQPDAPNAVGACAVLPQRLYF